MTFQQSTLARETSSQPVQFNRWITCPSPNPAAPLRLFCLPFAGGGASVFRGWGQSLSSVELCPIQLPGRENRLSEPSFTTMGDLVERLAEEIMPFTDKPFALFGHSMGALVSFELTRALRRRSAPLPTMLFLSAMRAAHLPLHREPLHGLDDAAFLAAVKRFGGTPSDVFQHPELIELILPTLRADLRLCDGYRFEPDAPLDCPFILYAGRQDGEATPTDVEPWRQHTTRGARLRIFPGDHFFLRSDRDLLMRAMASALA
ncbi:thioesterase II family protein [Rhodospirillum sp. A1_3_36]|uniref:thioesterase II family protein n=1 Tax=Rhodospirillum sp. A1_3_36 TaxID=3391666 RepID=UPI0039A5F3E6